MPKETVKVSAIISTYNAERFIRGCLDDLIGQTLYQKDELEIVIVNSGSQENEEDIVKEYQRRYENIVFIKTETRETVYEAWNKGIKVSRGKYITNANTDDRHRIDALEKMSETLEEHRNIGLVYADSLVIVRPNETFSSNSATHYFSQPSFSLRQALMYCHFGSQPMWLRLVHDHIGFFNPRYKVAGDYDFFIQLSWKFGGYHIPDILGLYLMSSGVESQNADLCFEETQDILRRYRMTIPIDDIYPIKKYSVDRREAEIAAKFDFANCLLYAPYSDYQLAVQYYYDILPNISDKLPVLNNLAVCLALIGIQSEGIKILQKLGDMGNTIAQKNMRLLRSTSNMGKSFILIPADHPCLRDLPPLLPQDDTLKLLNEHR